MPIYFEDDQVSLYAPDFYVGKMFRVLFRVVPQSMRISELCWRRSFESVFLGNVFLVHIPILGRMREKSY